MQPQTYKTIFAVIITAIIVGGGVYIWQGKMPANPPMITNTTQTNVQPEEQIAPVPPQEPATQIPTEKNECGKIAQYNCTQSGGLFKDYKCECPFEKQIGQTSESMLNKDTGYCQTTHGGPGGELGVTINECIGLKWQAESKKTGVNSESGTNTGRKTTYTNIEKKYSIQFPSEYKIEDMSLWNGSILLHTVSFEKDNTNSFWIRADEREKRNSYLLHKAVGETTLGGLPAKKYILKDGYCDFPELCSPPMTVITTYKNGIEYAIEFYNVIDMSGENQDILSSFKFID